MNRNINNILITGGAGYIGSHITEELIKEKKNKVYIFDNLSTGYKRLINKKAHFIKGDIKNLNKLSAIINENNIDSIIHLAALLNVKKAEKNRKRYFKNNVLGTKNLIIACKGSTVKNIIFSSSCSVYGNVKGPVKETNKLNPKGYYGFTKKEGEKIVRKFAKKFDYNFGILRYFNVVGASSTKKIGEIDKSNDHLFKNIAIEYFKIKPKVKIYGNNFNTLDGTCVRDYMHVSDIAKIHIKTLKHIKRKNKSLVLNCGYGRGFSVLQIINVFKKLKKNVKIIFTSRRPGDVAQVYSDNTKIKKILKWKPKKRSVESILKSAINWEKKIQK